MYKIRKWEVQKSNEKKKKGEIHWIKIILSTVYKQQQRWQ